MKSALSHLPEADNLRRCYEEGQFAAIAGHPVDGNPYKRQDRRSAWETGWHAGRREAETVEPPTEAEIEAARPRLAALKASLLEGWSAAPFWSPQYRTDEVSHLWLESGRSACGRAWWPSARERVPMDSYTLRAADVPRCPACAAHGHVPAMVDRPVGGGHG